MGYFFVIAVTIGLIVLVSKHAESGFVKAAVIIACLLICVGIVTCMATDPEDPRVSVSGYTRKDGTVVSGYTRRYPNRPDVDSPYKTVIILSIILIIVILGVVLVRREEKIKRDAKRKKTRRIMEETEESFHKQIKEDLENNNNTSTHSVYKDRRQGEDLLEYNRILGEDVVFITRFSNSNVYEEEIKKTKQNLDGIFEQWGFIFNYDHPRAKNLKTIFYSNAGDHTYIPEPNSLHEGDSVRGYNYHTNEDKCIQEVQKITSILFQDRPFVAVDEETIRVLESYGCVIDYDKLVPWSKPCPSFNDLNHFPFSVGEVNDLRRLEKSFSMDLFMELVLSEKEKEIFNSILYKKQIAFLQGFLRQFDPDRYMYLRLSSLSLKRKRDLATYNELKHEVERQGWIQINRNQYVKLGNGETAPQYRDKYFLYLLKDAEEEIEKWTRDPSGIGKVWYLFRDTAIIVDKYKDLAGNEIIVYRNCNIRDGKPCDFGSREHKMPLRYLELRESNHPIQLIQN